ncbi:MAG: DUF2490 domain-containing protein [Spirochaetes bacterium]|nr:MAG: DUF2490 domain-containing protein [Spirochaetota bacterium]
MIKRLLVILFVVLAFAGTVSAKTIHTAEAYRSWLYLNYTAMISENWGFDVLGSHSYEYSRDNHNEASATNTFPKQTFLWELFAGPMYVQKFGDFTFKLPVWYYYQGFPTRVHEGKDQYFYTHNIEIVPTIDYKMGNWTFWNRIILHNKLYSSFYENDDTAAFAGKSDSKLANGHCLLVREYFRVQYSVNPTLRLLVGDEIFVGVIEDKDTKDITSQRMSPGFERKGLNQNRFYTGFSYTLAPGMAITPLYMFQTVYGVPNERRLTEKDHYLFLVLSYQMKLY